MRSSRSLHCSTSPMVATRPRTIERKLGNVKTEILFIERCLALLKPGGRLGIVLPEGIYNNPSLAHVRAFCEDRAFILAVVSLPQETFYSAGASVKASLLFMQRFTDDEKTDYDAKRRAAIEETDEKYRPEIEAESARTQRLIDDIGAEIKAAKPPTKAQQEEMSRAEAKAAIATAKEAAKGVPELRKQQANARKEFRKYEKRMAGLKAQEARQLLKERFDYPIFLYDSAHVGLSATGEEDTCDLYKSDTLGLPPGMAPEDTALEQYRRFRADPQAFILSQR